MRCLALDMGSTWTKAAYLDDAQVIRESRLPIPSPLLVGGERYEVDATAYFDQVLALLKGLDAPDAEGLLISTQMHGCILTDEDFRPVTPYISWRDGLGRKHLAEIIRRLGKEAAQPSGVLMKANLALCALLGRGIEGERLPQGARFCTLGGYLIGRLTGEHVCHMTNAAPSGLADICNGGWNHPLIRAAGLDSLRFPRIVTGLEPVGKWGGVAVYADWGDQQACAAGASLTPEKTLHISVGTAGLMGVLTNAWEVGAWENRPWLTPGMYLRTVSGLPGGRHMAGLEALLRAAVRDISGQEPAAGAVWEYLKHPQEAGQARDLWDILSRPAPQMLGAYYAAFADAYAKAAACLGFLPENVAFSGGAVSRNPALRQSVCQALGCTARAGEYDVWRGMLRLMEQIHEQS